MVYEGYTELVNGFFLKQQRWLRGITLENVPFNFLNIPTGYPNKIYIYIYTYLYVLGLFVAYSHTYSQYHEHSHCEVIAKIIRSIFLRDKFHTLRYIAAYIPWFFPLGAMNLFENPRSGIVKRSEPGESDEEMLFMRTVRWLRGGWEGNGMLFFFKWAIIIIFIIYLDDLSDYIGKWSVSGWFAL